MRGPSAAMSGAFLSEWIRLGTDHMFDRYLQQLLKGRETDTVNRTHTSPPPLAVFITKRKKMNSCLLYTRFLLSAHMKVQTRVAKITSN